MESLDKQKLIALLQKSEGTKLDFKAQLSLKTDSEKKELAKDVTAIANSRGGRGYIVFGIADKTKKILGIEDKKYSEEQIQQIISQRCDPPVTIRYDVVDIDEKEVGVLTIYKSSQKPHQIRQSGAFYIRRGSTTDIARREEIANMLQESGILQHERVVLHNADTAELDDALISEYIAKTGLASNTEDYYTLLDGIGIVGRDEDSSRYHPTVGGLLVFGYNPQKYLPQAGIRVINNYARHKVEYFTGSIIKLLDGVETYLKDNINDEAYPVDAVVDAVANAAVHRDYFTYEREIVVFIQKDKIEISNPGAMCGEDDTAYLIEEANPCRRNQWLYQRLLVIDNKKRFLKSGLGIKRMQEAFKQLGGVEFISYDRRNLFKVICPGPQSMK